MGTYLLILVGITVAICGLVVFWQAVKGILSRDYNRSVHLGGSPIETELSDELDRRDRDDQLTRATRDIPVGQMLYDPPSGLYWYHPAGVFMPAMEPAIVELLGRSGA